MPSQEPDAPVTTKAEALARRVRESTTPDVQLASELQELFVDAKSCRLFLEMRLGTDAKRIVSEIIPPNQVPPKEWFFEAVKVLSSHGYLQSGRFESLVKALQEERPYLHDPFDKPANHGGDDRVVTVVSEPNTVHTTALQDGDNGTSAVSSTMSVVDTAAVPAGEDAVVHPMSKALHPGVWAAVGVLAMAIIGLIAIVWPPPPPPSPHPMALTLVQLPPGDQALPKLMAALARLGPRAIVLDQPLRDLAAAHNLAPALRPLVEADPPIPLVVAPSPSGPPPTDAELNASACDVAAVRVMTELPEGVVGCALGPLDCDESSGSPAAPMQRGCLTVLSGVIPQALLPPTPELATFSFSLGPTLNTCEVDNPTLPFVVKRLAFPADLFASLNAESAAQAVLLRAGCACQACEVGLPLREPPASPEEAPWRTLQATELLAGNPTEATRAAVQGQVVLVMTQADRSVELTLDGGQLRAMSPGEAIATLAWSLTGP